MFLQITYYSSSSLFINMYVTHIQHELTNIKHFYDNIIQMYDGVEDLRWNLEKHILACIYAMPKKLVGFQVPLRLLYSSAPVFVAWS